MRKTVNIDDELMKKALNFGKYKTKKAAIEDGLRLIIQMNSQQKFKKFKGSGIWEGNLEKMRNN